MATIVIRKLDETVKRKLQVRAARNGRSMEAEAREILSDLVINAPRPARDASRLRAPFTNILPPSAAWISQFRRKKSNRPIPTFD